MLYVQVFMFVCSVQITQIKKKYFESTFFEEKLEEDTNKQEPELCSSKGMGSRCSAKSSMYVW